MRMTKLAWQQIGVVLNAATVEERKTVLRDDENPARFILDTLDALIPIRAENTHLLAATQEVWRWLDALLDGPDAESAFNNMVDVIVAGPLSSAEILVMLSFADLLPASEDTEYSRQALRSLRRFRGVVPSGAEAIGV